MSLIIYSDIILKISSCMIHSTCELSMACSLKKFWSTFKCGAGRYYVTRPMTMYIGQKSIPGPIVFCEWEGGGAISNLTIH